jgi:acyl-CoA thioester hydrolase
MADRPLLRNAYPVIHRQTTRWRDNDAYGHVNNAVFFEYVDSAVNRWLIETGALDVPGGAVIGLVAASECMFFAGLGFPDPVDAGLRTARVGRSSVTYEVGLFRGDAAEESARARFTHVCVGRDDHRPVGLPESLRRALVALAPPD